MNVLDTKIDTEKRFLSELMPYDTTIRKSDYRGCLNEYSFLLSFVKQAMLAFKCGDYEKFDAFVGDNTYLICAVKIAMLRQSSLDSGGSIQSQIDNAWIVIKELMLDSNESFKSKGLTVQDLLNPIDLVLTSDEMFLVKAFLLSAAKSVKVAKNSAPLLRNVELDLSEIDKSGVRWFTAKKFRKKLVQTVRPLLAEATVAFVREQARCLGDKRLEKMCSEDFTVKINGLSCLPKFWTYKTLLLAAEKLGVPIVIEARFVAKDRGYSVVAEDCIFLRARSKGGYIKSVPCGRDLAKAAIVIQGVVCDAFALLPCKNDWRKVIADQKLDVILAGAAASRQYPNPGENFRIKNLKDDEFEGYKIMAKDQVNALGNSSLVFIQRVYSKAVGELPQLVQAQNMLYKFWVLRSILPQEAVMQIPYYLEFECDK